MVWDECFCHIPDFHIMIVILSPWCRCYIGDEHGDQHVCPCQCDHCQAVCDESQTVWHSKSNSWKTISSKQFQWLRWCLRGRVAHQAMLMRNLQLTHLLPYVFFLGSIYSICFLLLSFAVILVIVTIVYCCYRCCRHCCCCCRCWCCQCGTYFEVEILDRFFWGGAHWTLHKSWVRHQSEVKPLIITDCTSW